MANSKKILVTGGAGFIGSHTTKLLQEQGRDVVVLDNLSTGHVSSVSCPLIIGDLSDRGLLNKIFSDFDIDTVIHFAASVIVEESMILPGKYFENNVVNSLNLLNAMAAHGISKIIFSSSAAVYGEPHYLPIDEDHPKMPTNPYGETKLMVEKILKWYLTSHNLSSVSLRYFNASGAHSDGSLGENKAIVTHLIPRVLRVAAHQTEVLQIYGNDYSTPDGTCIRDYVHVLDLAQAHFLALEKLDKEQGCFAYNVATGKGHSVTEVVNAAVEITKKMIPIEYAIRRSGDPTSLVADASKITNELGFSPKYSDLETIIGTAWVWHQRLLQENLAKIVA
ncbi:MAG: UDP-glucose 4-epimerase GalE [Candidatus Doudnabacteria bacterium RIFCSPLOWO2_01_FULL_44_21]|uniref:UDP-glucose 4-epimerase n=1 Tax=Candidatus Doudnabacteria bacterium RIFCSPLOWO2_01_FULL_44_21 TaxID=1817841 RepID=A0A1F5PXJ1_9BACT|nr:MAG: UDP-glucose 4-epimerase GalE [Candidatus Doudnabacteria bacterium RIFCSPHIGHO2_02_FULL_43_13b]OGE94661.1 MAG: UDP-glucose 4-epimerase GalE [Candidatus Doudnabacteria bacterium RIFCSPLOWO2_01_FULL_44_21]